MNIAKEAKCMYYSRLKTDEIRKCIIKQYAECSELFTQNIIQDKPSLHDLSAQQLISIIRKLSIRGKLMGNHSKKYYIDAIYKHTGSYDVPETEEVKEYTDETMNYDSLCSCGKVAKYGSNIKQPTHCYKCKEKGMKEVCTSYCIVNGCTKRTTHIKVGYNKKMYCTQHGEDRGGISRVSLCIECKKVQPSYSYKGKKCLCSTCSKLSKYRDEAKTTDKMCIVCHKIRPMYCDSTGKRKWCSKCVKGVDVATMISTKTCESCHTKHAGYGTRIEGIKRYCKQCGDRKLGDRCYNLKSKRCVLCKENLASYGPQCEEDIPKSRMWCRKCVDENDIPAILITTRCKVDGCHKQAYYGYSDKKATVCGQHKEDGMVVRKKIILCKCGKQPSYGFNNKYTHCVKCKLDGMVPWRKWRCQHVKKCDIIPTYGYDKGKPLYCYKHKKEGTTDVSNRMCTSCGLHQARFGLPNHTRTHCYVCKNKDMIDLTHKKCKTCKLTIATYGYNRNKPISCVKCKKFDMCDVVNKRCIQCGITTVYHPRKICYRCSNQGYHKEKEEKVVDYLRSLGYSFIHNKRVVAGDCNYMPDILFICDRHCLIVEIDEHQHGSYNQEDYRMIRIQQALKKPCVFIRFNPDAFRIQNRRRKIRHSKRLRILKKKIDTHLNLEPKKELSVLRLFYNNSSGTRYAKWHSIHLQ